MKVGVLEISNYLSTLVMVMTVLKLAVNSMIRPLMQAKFRDGHSTNKLI